MKVLNSIVFVAAITAFGCDKTQPPAADVAVQSSDSTADGAVVSAVDATATDCASECSDTTAAVD